MDAPSDNAGFHNPTGQGEAERLNAAQLHRPWRWLALRRGPLAPGGGVLWKIALSEGADRPAPRHRPATGERRRSRMLHDGRSRSRPVLSPLIEVRRP